MPIDYEAFIHPSDKAALAALKALPGFDFVTKKFMSIIGEKMFKIQTTSSYLKLGPDQMPEIYDVLVRVCKSLGLDVPELYLALDREPNAGTYGDTDIFIVLHSGLLETLSIEQIETVIAHECGHILCHHCLYSTMGRLILSGADIFANDPISGTILAGLQYAFYYWMRCSEFSADRVSAYYYNSPEPVVDLMMSLAGGTRNLPYTANKDAFVAQAAGYKELIDGSAYNRILEFIQYGMIDHPLVAYRAYEIRHFFNEEGGGDENPLLTESGEAKTVCLTVRYEYVKSQNLLKLGGVFDNTPITVTVNGIEKTVPKNESVMWRVPRSLHTMTVTRGNVTLTHGFSIIRNKEIKVIWNAETETLSIE